MSMAESGIKRGLKMKILHNASFQQSQELLSDLQAANEDYKSRIATLKRFRNSKKVQHTEAQHQTEWMVENERLKQIHFKLQQEIDEHWGSAISMSPDYPALFNILEIKQRNKQDVDSLCGLLSSQLDDLEQLLKQIATKPAANQEISMANAVVADLFVQYRNNHELHWSDLHREETALRSEVSNATKNILQMIQSDTLQQQEQQFNEELMNILREESGSDVDAVQGMIDAEVVDVIEAWYAKLSSLDHDHQLVMQRKQEEKQIFCHEIQVENGTYKGWDVAEHDMFVKVYKKAQSTGMKRKLMMDLLTNQLPNKSTDEIFLHEEWYRKMKMVQNKYKDIESNYRTTRLDLLQEARMAIRDFIQQKKIDKEQEELSSERERRRIELHERLLLLRQQKAGEMAEQLNALRAQQLELAAIQEDERRAFEAERLHKKEIISAYQKQREQMLAEQEKVRAVQEAEAAQKLRDLIEANKPKVEMRTQKYYDKVEKKKMDEEEAIKQEERRLELLNKIAQQASYWSAIQDIKSKLDHATISSKAQEYIEHDAPTRGHIPLQGFADTRIIKDARFRLVEALRMANLQHSSAARDAVKAFCPRPHLAIHGII